jgi:hypothetical protein
MNIDSNQISLMRELVEVQEARKANWPTPHGPADKGIESVHRAKISAIRKKLSDRRVSEPENSPAADVSHHHNREGVEAPRRATFSELAKWMRKAFRSHLTSNEKSAGTAGDGTKNHE